MEFVSLEDFVDKLPIEEGDHVLVSNDIKKLYLKAMKLAKHNHQKFNHEILIDLLIKKVGPQGTIAFPTYNYDFCHGVPYDIKNAPCQVGALNNLAMQRSDFKRTKHPIFSFAVAGFYQAKMVALDNTDAFASNSPFAFMKEHHFKNLIIDVSLQHSFTFTHYVEQMSGIVKYRFTKNFIGDYIDVDGKVTKRTYSMFVRYLDRKVVNTVDPIIPKLIETSAVTMMDYGDSHIMVIDLYKDYDVMMDDIVNNKSRCLCDYDEI